MKFNYKSLSQKSESLVKEKGSKFIGVAIPVTTEEEIKHELLLLKSEHSQATHICYAYKIGVNELKFRANDDGEPSNSAGTPILGQLNSFELTNLLIAVIRYYGGTKLGVGGLVQAYKQAAKEAIENGEICIKTLKSELQLSFDYHDMPKIMTLIKQLKLAIKSQNLNEICTLNLELETDKFQHFKEQILNLNSVIIQKETLNS